MSYIGNKPANKAVVASDLDPAVITGQTALATSPADTDEFLISDAGVLKRLDASLIGGANTPAFSVQMNGVQTLNHNTTTKLEFDTEIFDSDSKYDTSAYRFTPTVVGKYLITLSLYFDGQGQNNLRNFNLMIYKNGSVYAAVGYDSAGGYGNNGVRNVTSIMELDADDYVEAYGNFFVQDSSTSAAGGTGINQAQFSGYKIIT